MANKVLIFRRGSIGDAVVSVPALNVIRSQHKKSELRILTNTPVMGSAAPIQAVIGKSNQIQGYFTAPPGGGGIKSIKLVRDQILHWNPDTLIYLSEPSNRISLIREYLFFRSCGIQAFIGAPFGDSLRKYQKLSDHLWESESQRLVRAISTENTEELSWMFYFDQFEFDKVQNLFSQWDGSAYIALSIGAKLPDKDWGDYNWGKVIQHIGSAYSDLGIVCIGAEAEKDRCNRLTKDWNGPVLNLCGVTQPRISALAMQNAQFYLGHDSGPMHLAALVKTRCIAIFSSRAKPGVWFPRGEDNHVFYPWSTVHQASHRTGFRTAGNSIKLIKAEAVIEACEQMLARPPLLKLL